MATVPLVACGDEDATGISWTAGEYDLRLYSFRVLESNRPNAFDFIGLVTRDIEDVGATGTWDVALGGTGDQMSLWPPGALGITSDAAIAVLERTAFPDATLAPADSASYSWTVPAIVELGNVYVIRTRKALDSSGNTCLYYAKLEARALDTLNAAIDFVYDWNPNCGDRRLAP